MHPHAERRHEAHAEIADVVDEALEDDRLVRGDRAGLHLIGDVRHEVHRGALVEPVRLLEHARGFAGLGFTLGGCAPETPVSRSSTRRAELLGDLARELADARAERGRASCAVAVPEGHLSWLSGRGRHEDAIARDRVRAPRARAEKEHLTLTELEDHLLVELADALSALLAAGREEDAVEAAVGDRAAVDDREALAARARAERVLQAIPSDARAELGELVGGVAPGEHVEHALERAPREIAVRRGAADQVEARVDGNGISLDRDDRDDLLGDDVERVLEDERLFDRALVHAGGGRGACEEIRAVLRHEDAARHAADLVARAPDALQARRDRRRRLDLDDEVDGAHVDAELERRRGDDRGEIPALEAILDDGALLARDRAVVREGDLLAREIVERGREALGEPSAVDEDHRRAVRADELDDARVKVRPDRVTPRARRGRAGVDLVVLSDARHVDVRRLHGEDELLRLARVDDLHGARGAVHVTTEEARGLRERLLRGREADALERFFSLSQRLEALERHEEVRSALVVHELVDLVDDDRLDVRERLSSVGREQEIERLGRRDEDVRRVPQHPRALGRGRVARSNADRDAARARESRRAAPEGSARRPPQEP